MSLQHDGVKTIKIYGKQGRRVRAKERLEAQIIVDKKQLDLFKRTKTRHEKKPSFYNKDSYMELTIRVDNWSNGISKKEKELETLKSRI